MSKQTDSQQEKLVHRYQASLVARHALREWYQSPLGKIVAEQESKLLVSVLPNMFGYHLLQLSEWGNSSYLDASLIRHKVVLDVDSIHLDSKLNTLVNAHKLAIASDSVDVVLLPHTLDVDMAPHQVLREADRVMVPEGRIVILSFNPWSTWGLRHICNLWSKKNPWNLAFFSPARIKDWLVLLGFEIEKVQMVFFRPPIAHPLLQNNTKFLEIVGSKIWPAFGAVYMLVARKQVSTLTPIRPRWYLRRRSSVSPGFLETRQ